ncbi:hypothetical protein GCM10007157_08940 [Vreelandella hamiltonii]|uniref:Flagella basal body P-ring formation protein FlgA n=1 Tax=Vreelandella hamiltonii TaxID=502829 RepID=A0A8H9I5D1_9GAMM|nr:hypothetical protein GCM10007157_08940 [Halomonas hamiltonii]
MLHALSLVSAAAMRKLLTLLALIVIALPHGAQARDLSLEESVHMFLYQHTQALGQEAVITVTPPSPHLPACVQPDPFLANTAQPPVGRVSVGVRCGTDGRQVRYMQAQVDVVGSYVVALRDIERGTLITADMLSQRDGNLSNLAPQTLTDQTDIIGKVAQRPIRSGSSFQAHFLQAPHLVERGQRVTVIAQGSGFRVSREGEAMANGARGDIIRVRFGSREIATARVIDQGILVVDF